MFYTKEELFSQVLSLLKARKVGIAWVALCVFHPERHPSLFVYEDFHYHCYGCHAHGSIYQLARHLGIIGEYKLPKVASLKVRDEEQLELAKAARRHFRSYPLSRRHCGKWSFVSVSEKMKPTDYGFVKEINHAFRAMCLNWNHRPCWQFLKEKWLRKLIKERVDFACWVKDDAWRKLVRKWRNKGIKLEYCLIRANDKRLLLLRFPNLSLAELAQIEMALVGVSEEEIPFPTDIQLKYILEEGLCLEDEPLEYNRKITCSRFFLEEQRLREEQRQKDMVEEAIRLFKGLILEQELKEQGIEAEVNKKKREKSKEERWFLYPKNLYQLAKEKEERFGQRIFWLNEYEWVLLETEQIIPYPNSTPYYRELYSAP